MSLQKLRHQGPLEKQGKLKTWAWKKYWFTLQDSQLIYIKEDGKRESRKRTSSSHGEINMNDAQCVKECHGIAHGFPFQITTKSRNHILSAESSTSRSEWIDVLQQAMIIKGRRSTLLSEGRESTFESDDGAYESMMSVKSISTESSPPADSSSNKPALTMSQSEREREPRCHSEYLGDDHYDAVFDAIESNEDEEDQYAEVVNAIHSKDHKTNNNNKQKQQQQVASSNTGSVGPDSYSYVQMRTKTAKDYEPKGTGSVVDDYSDVYGNGENSGEEKRESQQSSRLTSQQDNGGEADGDGENHVAENYAKVLPKALRQTLKLETQESVETAEDDENYDDVEVHVRNSCYDNNNVAEIKDLPNPRLELITTSAFDEIRRFLALNRGPTEIYKTPPSDDLGGKAVEKLRQMLTDFDADDHNHVVIRPKEHDKEERTVESTHL